MKNRKSFVLFPEDHRLRIGFNNGTAAVFSEVDLQGKQDAESLADRTAEQLRSLGYKKNGVMLAVPSSWCLCAPVNVDAIPRKKRHETLTYRLEEQLPVAAESFVADFIVRVHGALGVCLRLDRAAPLVRAMEDKGIAIERICPVTLLALQQMGPMSANIAIWQTGSGVEVLPLEEGLPAGWYLCSKSADDMLPPLVLAAELLHQSMEVAGYQLQEHTRTALNQCPEPVQLTNHENARDQCAVAAGIAALEGRIQPWIDFRRDALAAADPLRAIKRPLVGAVAALITLCLCASISMFVQSLRYMAQARATVNRQEELFRKTLPKQSTPLNVRSRLASEAQKLSDLHNDTSASSTVASVSALVLLRDALATIPTDLRFRITELQLAPDQLFAEGQVGAHSDAERLAKAFNQSHHWLVDSPRTQQTTEGNVAFTITGSALGNQSVLDEKGSQP